MILYVLITLLLVSLAVNVMSLLKFFYCKKINQYINETQNIEVEAVNNRLKDLQIFNQRVLDNIPVSVAVIDSKGFIILTNKYFRKLSPWYRDGESTNILDSRRIKEVGLSIKFENALKTGIGFTVDGVRIKVPKPYYSYYINFEVIPFKDDNNNVIGAISIGQEVTSLMKTKNRLDKTNDELNVEVRKRTEEFYQLNSQLANKIDFYENIFNFTSDYLKKSLSQINETNQSVDITEHEQLRHNESSRFFKDFIYLNHIEKNKLDLKFERVSLSAFIDELFKKTNFPVTINNLSNQDHVLIDIEKISHVLESIHSRFYKNIEQSRITIDKSGNQLNLKINFDIHPEVNHNGGSENYFWDVQLFMYKEIINLHKGILVEKLDDNKISFDLKFLLAPQNNNY